MVQIPSNTNKKKRKQKIYLNYVHMNLKMEQYIQANGKMDKDMEEENNGGMMVLIMKVTGKIIRLMEKED